ncbi:hypothetical protein [Bradyrhizobium liaoningense]|uniref:hypothetical protein n=1 Tax=Bradyrhizobium liaoningense TaxID=43992 RepID=UPI001BAD67EC|nr:hypothetical protein [Bradyrhizobium liaoningense]MBR0716508.1 hypothetical protein [Bradyrhizobium liaoningense]
MPLGDGALAVAYYNVEDERVIPLHTKVPQEPSGLGWPALSVFEASRHDGKE